MEASTIIAVSTLASTALAAPMPLEDAYRTWHSAMETVYAAMLAVGDHLECTPATTYPCAGGGEARLEWLFHERYDNRISTVHATFIECVTLGDCAHAGATLNGDFSWVGMERDFDDDEAFLFLGLLDAGDAGTCAINVSYNNFALQDFGLYELSGTICGQAPEVVEPLSYHCDEDERPELFWKRR